MANFTEYLRWRGDIPFSYVPLNEIDSMIFCELCYIPYADDIVEKINTQGVTICELSELVFNQKNLKSIGAILPTDKIYNLLMLVSNTERFKNIMIKNYVNEVDLSSQKQFSAMWFDVFGDAYIGYCGTDDTIVGWKESLNLSTMTPIPSQEESGRYLSKIANCSKGNIYLGGHSKGGNLAEYAALTAEKEIQQRIISVHSFDGPGFQKDFVEKYSNDEISKKIVKILPQSAIVGLIFDSAGSMRHIISNAKGFYQHDAFTWEIESGSFVLANGPDKKSIKFYEFMKNLYYDIDESERAEFIEAIYHLLSSNQSKTLTDIVNDKFSFFVAILKTEGKYKKPLFKMFKKFLHERYFKRKRQNNKKEQKI
ncbi:MAG: DUF2974 domain-containing protein [Clostridia bacterium]|nr:DUF2974 domain-containing protein [Clostridia bacterium]